MHAILMAWQPVLLLVLSSVLPSASACSRVLYETKMGDVYVSRTFDWEHSFHTNLLYYPRNRHMDGGCGPKDFDLCKTWTSKYYSLVATANDWASKQVSTFTGKNFSWIEDGVIDGVNEAGLAVHTLYLQTTQYKSNEPMKNAVTWWRWSRYLLDVCGSVAEAVRVMESEEIVVAGVGMPRITLHMAVDDKTGDSAIFEILDGSVHIYSKKNTAERDLKVLTNDPVFTEQLNFRNSLINYTDYPKSLSMMCDKVDPTDRLQPSHYSFKPGSFPNRCLPGDVTGLARFTRLSWFSGHLKSTKTDGTELSANEMLGKLRSVMLSVAVPSGAPDVDPWENDVYPTWWYSAFDFKRGLYFWQYYEYPNVIYINLTDIGNLTEVSYLPGVDYPELSGGVTKYMGDVTGSFKEASAEISKDSAGGSQQQQQQKAPIRRTNLRQQTDLTNEDTSDGSGDSSDVTFMQTETRMDL